MVICKPTRSPKLVTKPASKITKAINLTTPAAFLLAGASDAKRQNTKVTLSIIPKYFLT